MSFPAPLTAGLYLRVSTRDQTTDNQEPELRAWAARLGLTGTHVHIYRDQVSGSQQSRPGLDALLRDAHEGRLQILLVWSLDRLTRAGLGHLHQVLDQLAAAGVEVRSFQEPWLSVPAEIRPLLVSIFGWVAAFERRRIGERVRAGQLRAKAAGVKFGRPLRGFEKHGRYRPVDASEIARLRFQGKSWAQVAKILGTPVPTLRRHLLKSLPRDMILYVPEKEAGA